jgi:hypothetical protein
MSDLAPPSKEGGRKRAPRTPRKLTAASISRELREMGLTSLHFVGGVQYLNRIAKKNPAAYLAFIAKLIKTDDGADPGGITFVVQQVNVQGVPIKGVVNSPVVEHVVPLKLAAANGEVIDMGGDD